MRTRRFLLAALGLAPVAWLSRRRLRGDEIVVVDGWVLRADDLG